MAMIFFLVKLHIQSSKTNHKNHAISIIRLGIFSHAHKKAQNSPVADEIDAATPLFFSKRGHV
jgi:hypothetical protein